MQEPKQQQDTPELEDKPIEQTGAASEASEATDPQHSADILPSLTESLRQAELERAVRLLARGDDPHKVLEALSHGLTNKLMHGPTRYLNQVEVEHKAETGQFVRQLFNLPHQG